ncbi:MAG: hypothetical protein AB1758_14045 [Candidatus Eremiobacterota bacterium]
MTPMLVADPRVRVRSPKQGHVTGPRPRIRLETEVGDVRYDQVDLGRLELRLDGQDLKPYLKVRSKIDRKLRPGKPFERLRLEARPPQPLAPGQPTVELVS